MQSPEGPSRLNAGSEPLITLHISKRVSWLILAALIMLCVLAAIFVRQYEIRESQIASVPISAPAEEQQPVLAPEPVKISEHVAVSPTPEPVPQPKSAAIPAPASPSATAKPGGVPYMSFPAPVTAAPAQPAPAATTPVLVLPPIGPTSPASLTGAGAASPAAVYNRWFERFHSMHSDVNFTYTASGSGAGVRQTLERAVDFGATDVPLSDDQLAHADTQILHVPTVLSAVVPVYNAVGAIGLRFTPDILAGIFLGKIKNWNDPEIAKANPGLHIPSQPISVIHRSDGCATTFIFTDYLSKVSSEWQSAAGKGTSVHWPLGLSAKGNEGVTNLVRQTFGAIGYVDLIYATQSHVTFASVENHAGEFVKASLDSLTEAAASVRDIPPDFRVSITDAPGKKAYPIASFTWLVVPEEIPDFSKRQDLIAFLRWMITDGQNMTRDLGFAPVPRNVADSVNSTLAQLP